MKCVHCFLLIICCIGQMAAQNVGINTSAPENPFQVNVDSSFVNTMPDQSATGSNSFLTIASGQGAGQSVICGLTGALSEVDLTLSYSGSSSGTVNLKVRHGLAPGGDILKEQSFEVTDSVAAVYPVIFSEPLPAVDAGDSIFLELSYVSGGNVAWSKNNGNPYPQGSAFLYTGSWTMLPGDDMLFTTYIDQPDSTSLPILKVTQEGRVSIKNYSLPAADGSAGQLMTTDGNGEVGWTATDSLGFWGIHGNAGTDTTQFIGTTDDQPLRFKVNQIHAGIIDLNYNTAIGVRALDSITTGILNTAIGFDAIKPVNGNEGNTAVGAYALADNFMQSNGNIGDYNTALGNSALAIRNRGSYNTAVGSGSLLNNGIGSENTAIGDQAMRQNDFGNYNVAIGANALYAISGGSSNIAIGPGAFSAGGFNFPKNYIVAIGDSALYQNGNTAMDSIQATANTAIGSKALFSNTVGFRNTATGFETLYSNTEGYQNTALGYHALYFNNTGDGNTAVGALALFANTNGLGNTAIGEQALHDNTFGSFNMASGTSALQHNIEGFDNVASGYASLFSNTSGSDNTATGYYALYYNTTGNSNTAFGSSALAANTGGENTAVGAYALSTNSMGLSNTAVGFNALFANDDGNGNCAVGKEALHDNTGGDFNTAIGDFAMEMNSTGIYNTAIGVYALRYNVSGHDNCAFGNGATNNMGTNPSNFTAIGHGAGGVMSSSNNIEIGNASVSWIGGQVGWSTYSDARIKEHIQDNVPGLAFIGQLHPVTYNLNIHRENELCGRVDSTEWEGKYDIENIVQSGFIAQEVEAAAKNVGYDFSGVKAPQGNANLYSLQYAVFVVPLVKAVQELDARATDQQKEIDKLSQLVKSQQETINVLMTRLETPDR